MLLQLQKYDLNVIFKPGKEMLLADALSRNFSEQIQENDPTLNHENAHIFSVLSDV